MTALEGTFYDGAVLKLTRTGPPAQIGYGANGKNINLGLSASFDWHIEVQSIGNPFPLQNYNQHGDFNMDLSICPVCESRLSPANKDSCGIYSGGHAIVTPFSDKMIFTNNPAPVYSTFPDGTATITGRVRGKANKKIKFDVVLRLSDKMGYETNTDKPKEELNDSCYVDEQGEIDPSTWFFYGTAEGTMTALEDSYYDGTVIQITRTGPPAQIGYGANGKNTNYGFSMWFDYECVGESCSDELIQPANRHADFNLDVAECVPEPLGDCPAMHDLLRVQHHLLHYEGQNNEETGPESVVIGGKVYYRNPPRYQQGDDEVNQLTH